MYTTFTGLWIGLAPALWDPVKDIKDKDVDLSRYTVLRALWLAKHNIDLVLGPDTVMSAPTGCFIRTRDSSCVRPHVKNRRRCSAAACAEVRAGAGTSWRRRTRTWRSWG